MDILEQARELGQAILNSPEYERYEKAQKAQSEDEDATSQIKDYNNLRNELALRIKNTNPPQDEIDEVRATLEGEYHKLRKNPIIDEFIEANEAYYRLVENVNGIISMFVSGKESGGCSGGGCSSCSGCN